MTRHESERESGCPLQVQAQKSYDKHDVATGQLMASSCRLQRAKATKQKEEKIDKPRRQRSSCLARGINRAGEGDYVNKRLEEQEESKTHIAQMNSKKRALSFRLLTSSSPIDPH